MPFVFANVLQPLIDVFEQVLLFFHDTVGASWGLSIILMTVAVRAVLLPLTFKQFRSMAAMQKLAPEMKALQAKYKDDRQRLNQEMMKFYQENKVNPFSSCLPLIAQMPVFIALFYMLRADLKIDICDADQAIAPGGAFAGQSLNDVTCDQIRDGSAGFGFIPDLTAAATGGILAVLIVLYVGSQLLSSVMMSTTVDKNQRRIMIALPFVFVFFILNFPAGLILYWITTNFWTVGQQYFVRRSVGMSVPGRPGDLPQPDPIDFGKMFGGKGKEEPVVEAKGGKKATGGSTAVVARPAGPPPSARKKKKKTGRRR
ncbi:MAG: rane protein insertase, YidC/Oxa1 family [Solirubrobacterales bacterium]|jgi:YidC/Oxa1 family membrane protein insertase|nr:rane protein insertase, YidC/Oxa1 family [Solirubrobacterales bacterium]